MTETPVSEMDFKLRLDLAGLCNNAADTLDRCGETGEAFDLREVARLVAELKAGKGTLAEFCDVLCLPLPTPAPVWNHDMSAAPRDGTPILAYDPDTYDSEPVILQRRGSAWTDQWFGGGRCYNPVAWMPLPPLPEETR